MKRNYLHAYAIVRFDTFGEGPVSVDKIDRRITVKKIVFDPDYAEAECRRLNELNRDKGTHYFWHVTRIEQPLADKHDRALEPSVDEISTARGEITAARTVDSEWG